ncbi:MAG: hypothetical protein GX548_01390 [Lentisphaerae bacterium]|nr:hypothetical protein [Lentisphaerota bacterium]
MKNGIRSKVLWGAVLFIAMGMSGLTAIAQMPGAPGAGPGGDLVRIRRMTPTKEKTPVFRTATASQASARQPDWWRVVVDFETSADWLDELECTYYVYMKDQSNKGAEVMFRGSVTYVNVPKGRHQSDMFLHPGTLARMGNPEQVAVVMKHRGAVVGTESTAKTPNWWERFSPVDGVLLNRSQTPFAFIDYDAFNAIKPQTAAR